MDKSLKKLRRSELLELMVQLSDECEKLARENNRLRQKLSERRLPRNAKVGSIAEAALQANGYFEAAQRSADEYLREIKYLRDELALRTNRTPDEAREVVASAQEQARMKARAQEQVQRTLKDAQDRANQILASARSQARAIVQEAQGRAGNGMRQPGMQQVPAGAQRQGMRQVPQQMTYQNQQGARARYGAQPNATLQAQQAQRAQQMQQAQRAQQMRQAQQAQQSQYAQQFQSAQQQAPATHGTHQHGAHQRGTQAQAGRQAAAQQRQPQDQQRASRHGRRAASNDANGSRASQQRRS